MAYHGFFVRKQRSGRPALKVKEGSRHEIEIALKRSHDPSFVYYAGSGRTLRSAQKNCMKERDRIMVEYKKIYGASYV